VVTVAALGEPAQMTTAGLVLGPALRIQYAPGRLIRIAQQVHLRIWSDRISAVTSSQYAILLSVASEPGVNQGVLADKAVVDSVTAAGIVRRLVRDGLLVRRTDPRDRRRYALSLSSDGLSTFRSVTPEVLEVQRELLAPLNEIGQVDILLDLLRGVARLPRESHVPRSARLLVGRHSSEVPRLLGSPGHLIRVAQQVHQRLWAGGVGSVMTSPQYSLLDATAREPGLDQATVGSRVSIDKATSTEIIKRLLARGYISRRSHPRDARRNVLTLTTAGLEALAATTETVFEIQDRLVEPLTAKERRVFPHLMAVLARIESGSEPMLRDASLDQASAASFDR
jgi:MarR family transcriptional regulator, lower aerobic nicotinate degradation pathway regulator